MHDCTMKSGKGLAKQCKKCIVVFFHSDHLTVNEENIAPSRKQCTTPKGTGKKVKERLNLLRRVCCAGQTHRLVITRQFLRIDGTASCSVVYCFRHSLFNLQNGIVR